LKVTYTDEAVADIVEAITYLNERNPTAAATSTLTSRSASNAWQIGSLRGRSRDFAPVLSCGLGRPAVPNLLPAASGRTVDRAHVSPGAPTHHAIARTRG
jgi:hypothetical protein